MKNNFWYIHTNQDIPCFLENGLIKAPRKKPRPAFVSEVRKAKHLRGKGLTYQAIADELDRDPSTIYGWLRRQDRVACHVAVVLTALM